MPPGEDHAAWAGGHATRHVSRHEHEPKSCSGDEGGLLDQHSPGRIDAASRIIEAPPATIYQAFAQPESMMRWLPPEGMTGRMLDFDFREGGGYRMRLRYTDPAQARGKTSEDADVVAVQYSKLIPGRRIEQRVNFDSSDPSFAGEMRMIWSLEPRAAGTLVSIRCENVPDGIAAADHEAGLRSTLHNLAVFAEAQHRAAGSG